MSSFWCCPSRASCDCGRHTWKRHKAQFRQAHAPAAPQYQLWGHTQPPAPALENALSLQKGKEEAPKVALNRAQGTDPFPTGCASAGGCCSPKALKNSSTGTPWKPHSQGANSPSPDAYDMPSCSSADVPPAHGVGERVTGNKRTSGCQGKEMSLQRP